MQSRVAEADARHRKGYNCAQAVACTYADLVGVDELTMFKACEGLGLGMGGMEGTCGAASGTCVLAGFANSTGDLERPNSKASTYKISRELVAAFGERVGATRCCQIKGHDTGVVLMPCNDCVKTGARIVEEVLFGGQFED